MSEKTQTRLLTVLAIVVFEILKAPLSKLLLAEKVPGNRGANEDVSDAVVQAGARLVAVIIASALVRQLANRQG